ncbi:MAG: cytochrome c [Sandaracinaceae bacterium]|nr:cytochrome c [Sandaracinaceae bacterium]MBK8410537.1 cytochrome c [Sandaracinaceae bacterium]
MALRKLDGVWVTVALLLALGCDRAPTATETWTPADHAHPPDSVPGGAEGAQVPAAPLDDGLTPEQRTARTVYLVACAGCHGAEGRGDGPDRAPIMRLPNFQSAQWQATLSDDQLVSIITLGRGMMPAFGERVPPEGVRGLVAHLRSMAPPEPVEAPAAGPDGGVLEDGGATAAPSPHGTLSGNGEGVVE